MKGQQTNLQRKRKALLVLPFVVIPFLTMAFWAMGGGKGKDGNKGSKSEGLNLQLPNAQLSDDRDKTKLSFYEAQEKIDTDDVGKGIDFSFGQRQSPSEIDKAGSATDGNPYDPMPPGMLTSKDPNEEKVYQRLAELNKELTRQTSSAKKERTSPSQNQRVSVETEDVDRLAGMMQTVQSKSEPDAELEQLNGMMERILDIQHPDRVKEKLREESRQHKKQVYPVGIFKNRVNSSLLSSKKGNNTAKEHNPFLDERNSDVELSPESNAIAAAVQGNQILTSGSTVKLRLLADVYVAGTQIPKGNFVYGTATLEQDRLKISIGSLRYGSSLFPVSLTVYDLDGIEGIHVPGSLTRDVAKGSAEQSLQSIGLMSQDPTLKAQATAAGIQAAKGMLSKKVKQVKVTLKAGYQVLLMDRNSQQ